MQQRSRQIAENVSTVTKMNVPFRNAGFTRTFPQDC
jgi:hypothetical protein